MIKKLVRLGWGIQWTNEFADELHKPIRRKFKKRIVLVKNEDDIWAADLVEMQTLAKFNNGLKFILLIIDFFRTSVLRKNIFDGIYSTENKVKSFGR